MVKGSAYAGIFLLLVAQAVLAQQLPTSNLKVLELLAKNAPTFAKMLAAIKITSESFSKPSVGTFFAPSDVAVEEFLKSIGYSESELLAMPVLVDLIASYHFIPGHQVSSSDISKSPKVAATGDDNFIAKLSSNAAGKLTVEDVQGNVAAVVSGPLLAGKLTVYVIDKVLMSGNYFSNVAAALAYYPYWSSANAYIAKAGVQKLLDGTAGGFTLFVPDNVAFKPVENELSDASTARLTDVLKYHVATGGIRNIPRGFRNGTLAALLPGHSTNVTLFPTNEGFNPFTQKAAPKPLLKITPEAGRQASVTVFNIYAGRNILQGINSVLLPSLTSPTAAAGAGAGSTSKVTTEAAKPAAAAGGTKPTASVNTKQVPGGRRHLQQAVTKGVGYFQTFANGVTGENTAQAIANAGGKSIPLQYVNRFGTLEGPSAAGGCLNCGQWAAQGS